MQAMQAMHAQAATTKDKTRIPKADVISGPKSE
jgi:hypothetical protein